MNTRKNAKYLQIADAIRQNIQSGILPPDSKLAIEDTLMEQYQAGRNTVRHAEIGRASCRERVCQYV